MQKDTIVQHINHILCLLVSVCSIIWCVWSSWKVFQLGGIHTLIQLLKSENLDIQQTVAAALRNVVFKDPENKSTVKLYGGIKVILDLVKSNKEVEIQKQLTGKTILIHSKDIILSISH